MYRYTIGGYADMLQALEWMWIAHEFQGFFNRFSSNFVTEADNVLLLKILFNLYHVGMMKKQKIMKTMTVWHHFTPSLSQTDNFFRILDPSP